MLLKVGIDPDAGEELAVGLTKPGRLLVRYLKERCLLVAEPESAADLVRAFQGAAPELAQAITLLVGQRLTAPPEPSPVPLRDIVSCEQVGSWEDAAELLVLAETRLTALVEEADGDIVPEVTSLLGALNSDAVFMVNEHWEAHLRKGTHRETIWSERFEVLARHSRQVHIIDRYAAVSLTQLLTAKQPPKYQSGAQWFLGHLARSSVQSIHVASSARALRKNELRVDVALTSILGWFNALGTGSRLHLHVVDGDFDHGRRMAFEGWAGFELHNGMASFDKPRLEEDMSLNASAGLALDVSLAARALARESGGG
jgi:hypothetical protein